MTMTSEEKEALERDYEQRSAVEIRERREKLGMTQVQLSRLAGLCNSDVEHLELGKTLLFGPGGGENSQALSMVYRALLTLEMFAFRGKLLTDIKMEEGWLTDAMLASPGIPPRVAEAI